MANSKISELQRAQSLQDADLFIITQENTSKSLSAEDIARYIDAKTVTPSFERSLSTFLSQRYYDAETGITEVPPTSLSSGEYIDPSDDIRSVAIPLIDYSEGRGRPSATPEGPDSRISLITMDSLAGLVFGAARQSADYASGMVGVMDSDLLLAGPWTRVGNITKSSETAVESYPCAGRPITWLINQIFNMGGVPEVAIQPYATLQVSDGSAVVGADKYVEVGTTLQFSYTASFNQGAYTAFPGQVETGVTAQSYYVSLMNNSSETQHQADRTGSFSPVTLSDNDQYKVRAEVQHSASARPAKNAAGEDTDVSILAGSVSVSSPVVKAYRKYFYGALLTKPEVSDWSSYVRSSLQHSTKPLSPGQQFQVVAPEGTLRVAFAYPSAFGPVQSVVDVAAMRAEIKDSFSVSERSIACASSSTAPYYVYVMDFAEGSAGDTYIITLGGSGSGEVSPDDPVTPPPV